MKLWFLILPCLIAAAPAEPEPKPKEPAPAEEVSAAEQERQRIDRLLAELNSADFQTREKATAELIRVGPPALAALERRLAVAATPEFQARAKQVREGIARTWRYWSPDGGPISGGFQATLTAGGRGGGPGPTTFAAGGPIVLKLEIRNVCPEPRELVDVHGLDLDFGGDGGAVTSEFGCGKIIVRSAGNGQAAPEGRALAYDTGEPRTIQFKTGGNIMVRIPLEELVTLKPGEYEVRVVYYSKTKGLVKEAAEDLESNAVRFRVE